MSARSRSALFASVALFALVSLLLVGAVRERSDLPGAASRYLQATITAGGVTTCLAGVQDELYLPGVGRLKTGVASAAALARLRECDVGPLESAIASVHLPPQAPVDNTQRRRARAMLVSGLGRLRAVALNVRGAARAMTEDVHGRMRGTAIALAYRSASTGSDAAYALALKALHLLGRSQSGGPLSQ